MLNGGSADFGGFDRFQGGPGNDRILSADFGTTGNAPEPVSCGGDNDLIVSSDEEDRMAADCERAALPSQDGSAGTLTVTGGEIVVAGAELDAGWSAKLQAAGRAC